ncbi:MAG: hypothetical protein KGV51_06655 [Moraxellaceae bacterium]|nr:hypothetical protein [Moraxellaceae bacterium]
MNLENEVYKTALLLVEHFSNCIERESKGLPTGFHSRIFSTMLHPENEFVTIGKVKEVEDIKSAHPEHIVPCSVIGYEAYRLIEEGKSKEEIAKLITKHWKIVYITKEQADLLDTKKGINMKSRMPDDWQFEDGDTFARLKLAGIIQGESEILPLDDN